MISSLRFEYKSQTAFWEINRPVWAKKRCWRQSKKEWGGKTSLIRWLTSFGANNKYIYDPDVRGLTLHSLPGIPTMGTMP